MSRFQMPPAWPGAAMVAPRPCEAGPGRETAKTPWEKRTSPAPPQVVQRTAREPGLAPPPPQVSQERWRGTTISCLQPKAAS